MYGPVLKGKLVTLRPPRLEEAGEMAKWFADLDVTERVLLRFPPSIEQEEGFLKNQATNPNSVFWAIEYEGRLVGASGFDAVDWPNQRASSGTIIGDKSVWGRGLASEVMRLRTDYGFRQLGLRKLTSAFLEGNEASWKAMRKCGYREVGRRKAHYFRNGRWLDEILTEVHREDWEKLNLQS